MGVAVVGTSDASGFSIEVFVLNLPNFKASVSISSEDRTDLHERSTTDESESLEVRIYQPRNGKLHEAVKVECVPQGDGWYELRVFVDGKEEGRYASNERHEITHTHTSEGFRRDY